MFTLSVAVASPAQAHVVPTSTVVLDVHDGVTDAQLRIPLADLTAASGIDVGSGVSRDVASHEAEIAAYITQHFMPESSTGGPWAVTVDGMGVSSTEGVGTGTYDVLTATAHLVPPAGADGRKFTLGYDVVVHQVVTHVAIVSVRYDWSNGVIDSARELGTISVDTRSGETTPLEVDLGTPSMMAGFLAMVSLGSNHIREGVDHQLFLLSLLLPAGLLVVARRWGGPTSVKSAFRKIAWITLAFTLGHSVTLALGALGVPVPEQLVEATIALSIIVAAAHALYPLFPGKEVLIAGGFGLVHGLAFSVTLQELQLSGPQLALSLLGFNIGIELMQLLVVALALPPLLILARTRFHAPLRVAAASATIIAATGWLMQRLGVDNPVATIADGLSSWGIFVIAALWIAAALVIVFRRRAQSREKASPVLVFNREG
jgi:hypothetical protein